MSLLVVDGTALLLRAWFAGADALSVSRTFLRRSEAPRRAVVFDAGMVTFRTHLDPRYKADRPHPGEELIDLYNRFEESCEELGWAAFKKPGFEADDLAATLQAEQPTLKALLISGFAQSALNEGKALSDSTAFLGKPFRTGDLLRRVRGLLDR